jgi:uncharacterized protein YndB with AHSA1/START domain
MIKVGRIHLDPKMTRPACACRSCDTTNCVDRTVIWLDQFLAYSPTTVWRALTESGEPAGALLPSCDFRLELGHQFIMEFDVCETDGRAQKVRGRVLAFENKRMLCIGWSRHTDRPNIGIDWTTTWILEPEGRGTRLYFTHHDGDDIGNEPWTWSRVEY